ncbi:PHP domain-containing protein [Gordonia polyisoprenivorans]|uniref:PHP domain-containing protein n=1 Tax=Gordonia polyisoprenivorans TaxID=84595 RepID=UPI00197AF8C0|nr:PHP domain-containing protein [Gordonia polyisoprenivorans]
MRTLEPLSAPVEPIVALQRIAWLLERQRESTYRVEAFRKAARAAARLDPDDLESRSREGTLTSITGIGKTTATVIAEALDGDLPEYLARLQSTESPYPPGAAADLVAAARGDCHSHTDASDGGAPLTEMAAAATAFGLEWLTVTDHSPRLTVAHGLSAERLADQIEQIEAYNRGANMTGRRLPDTQVRLLAGIEVDILDDGALDQTDALLDRLDIVTASVHSALRMEHDAMTRRLVAAATDPRVDVLGHCTGRRVLTGRGHRPPSSFDAREVFEACATHQTAVEINSRPERVDPPDELVTMAIEAGCLFAIDSDAHAPGQLEFTVLGAQRAHEHGIDPDRIITTWPVDRLLAWAGHR